MAGRKQASLLLFVMALSALGWVLKNLGPLEDSSTKSGEYERLENCRFLSDRVNDGDSFRIETGAGERLLVRLYFVDTPETGVKRYPDGNWNKERLDHQAEYFGVSREQVIGIGKDARLWTRNLLREMDSFTIHTRREPVFNHKRVYALVEVKRGAEKRWLHELLVEAGLARIYTKGTDLSDGTSRKKQTVRLKGLEREAKAAGRGAWELARRGNRS